jgi:hypothetical protein
MADKEVKLNLEELILAPLSFLAIKDKELLRSANEILPYSIGLEINACYRIVGNGSVYAIN